MILCFTLGVIHYIVLDKCVITCNYHYWITEYFHYPKIFLCSAYSSFTHSWSLKTTDLTVSVFLPFTKCHVVGIIQYVTFSIGIFHWVKWSESCPVVSNSIQSMEISRPKFCSVRLCPSPGGLLGPGIELGSPALQANSLPA